LHKNATILGSKSSAITSPLDRYSLVTFIASIIW
jgi:hypothetical protein